MDGASASETGAVVGSHEGAHAYTVGQRRGLKLGVPAPDGKPRFVLEVRPVSNTVVVGPKGALATAEISGARFTWAGRAPEGSDFACEVQIRARAALVDDVLTVRPQEPFDGVAPGQTAVVYDGTRVLGQFTIDHTVSAGPVDA